MMCCKIILDPVTAATQFGKIFELLSLHGEMLWDGHYFYFANIDFPDFDETRLKKALKKIGCKDCFLEQYNKDLMPHETDQVNWWVEDKLIKIGYKDFEEQQQATIQEVYQQLSDIEDMIKTLPVKQGSEVSTEQYQ